MNRAERRNNTEKMKKKRKDMQSYTFWQSGYYKLPNKLKKEYNDKLDKSLEQDRAEGIDPMNCFSNYSRVWKEYNEAEKELGYFRPNKSSNNRRFWKKESNSYLRNRAKESLRKDPEEIGNTLGNNEHKNFDYWWTID